jgi:hypothetical protein
MAEGPAERVDGRVADGMGYGFQAVVGVAQPPGRQVHPPSREVGARGLASDHGEPPGQRAPPGAPGIAGQARTGRRRPAASARDGPSFLRSMEGHAKLGVDLVEVIPVTSDPVGFVAQFGETIVPRLEQIPATSSCGQPLVLASRGLPVRG